VAKATSGAQRAGDGPPVDERAAALLATARACLDGKDNNGAIAALKEVVTLVDCTPEVRLEAAGMFAAAGAKDDAIGAYLQAGNGFLYDDADMTRARQAFMTAHEIDPINVDVLFQLGQADVVEGRTQDALAKFIDVLRRSNLKHVPALFEAGCIYQANGQHDQAILAFKKVIDRDKTHSQAYVHMGQLHQTKGMVPEALGYYVHAADIARESGHVGTARQLLNMVLALDSSNQKARFMLDDLDDHEPESTEESDAAHVPKPAPKAVAAPRPVPAKTPPPPKVDEAAIQAAAAAQAESAAASAKADRSLGEARAELDGVSTRRDGIIEEIDRLAAARSELEAELARRKADAEKVIRRDSDEAIHADRERAELKSELAELAGQRLATELELESVKSTVENLRAEREQAEADMLLLRAQTDAATLARAAQEASLKEIETARAKAKADMDALVAQSKAAAEAKAAQEATLRELETKRAGALADVDSLLAQSTAAAKAKAAQEEALRELEEARAAAKTEMDALVAQSKAAAQAKAAQEAALKELEAKRAAAKADVDALAAQKAAAEKMVSDVREKSGRVVKAQASVEATIAELTAERTAAEKAKAAEELALQGIEARRAHAQAELEKLLAQKAAAELAAAAASEAADAKAAEEQALKKLVAERKKLHQELEALHAERAAAEEAVLALRSLGDEASREKDAAVASVSADLAKTKAALAALEAQKRDLDEAYANSKSLAAAAEQKRVEALAAAEKAEAVRAKREADAEALGFKLVALEASLKEADAKAKLVAGEKLELEELSAKVGEQRSAAMELQAARAEAQAELTQLRSNIETAQGELTAVRATLDSEQRRQPAASGPHADAVVATVPPEVCGESLRTIESLAAEGEIPFEAAAELAGLIHEGRAVEALRVARARANVAAAPGAYLLAVGDLSRDLGDVDRARDAYRLLGSVDAKRQALAHARLGELFLTFADQSTAAALQRDDAHFASEKDPAAALATYADLVARFPDDPQFREELGALHEKVGNTLAAGVAYEAAMVLYLGTDDHVRAKELIPRLLAVRPDDGAALELAARAFDRAGRTVESAATLDRALAAHRAHHRASDVERVCRRLAETADDPVPYRRELAKLLQEVGDLPGAIEQLTEAADRLVQWSRGQEALAALKEAEALAGDDPIFAERISALKLKATDAVKAVDDAARGDMFLSKGEFEKAADAYKRAVAENPSNAGAAYQLACLLTDHFPDYDFAEKLLDTAAALRPGHTATRYRMAVVKAARGEIGQAIELLIALARFDDANADFIEQFVARLERTAESGDVAAKYNLGIAYRELGRVEEALVILQSIQRETDYVVRCLNAIGLCLRRQGLDTAAAKRFQKAIETPGFPEGQYNDALYNLGDLYESKTDQESLALSLSSFEELYARDCTYRDVADKIRSVKNKIGTVEGPKVKRLPTRSAEISN
jgi:tetratricopeptide (TPR) repeat protein